MDKEYITTNEGILSIEISPSSNFESILRIPLTEVLNHEYSSVEGDFGYWFAIKLTESLNQSELIPFDSVGYVYGIRQLSTGKFYIGRTYSLWSRLFHAHWGNGHLEKYKSGRSEFILDISDFELVIFTIVSKSYSELEELIDSEESRFCKLTNSKLNGFNKTSNGKPGDAISNRVSVLNLKTNEQQYIPESEFDDSKYSYWSNITGRICVRNKLTGDYCKIYPEDFREDIYERGINTEGYIWIHNGNERRMISRDSTIPEGWELGSGFGSTEGLIMISNDNGERRYIDPLDKVPDGWWIGRDYSPTEGTISFFSCDLKRNFKIYPNEVINHLDKNLRIGFVRYEEYYSSEKYLSRPILTKDNYKDLIEEYLNS